MINRFLPIKITDLLPYYYASSEGKIYVLKEKNQKFYFSELKILFPDPKFKLGYVTLSFIELNKIIRKLLPVHWLIATTFHGNHELGYKIFFIDGDMQNTASDNLQWRIDRKRKDRLLKKLIWSRQLMTAEAIKYIELRDES